MSRARAFAPVSALCLALSSLGMLAGCTDDPNRVPDPPTDGGPPPDAGPVPPLPSTCSEPPLPAPLGRDAVVGDGTAASCTEDALRAAVEPGGNVTFDCGSDPATISISRQIPVPADTIIDGGGAITLDGGGASRMLAAESHVAITVIGLSFVRGMATSTGEDRASGGAIRGGWSGSVAAYDCSFVENVAGSEGEEGGGALYVPSNSTMTIVRCTFQRNRGGIGGAVHNLLSQLTIVNSTFIENHSDDGGGAVYTDGASAEIDDAIGGTIDLCGCLFRGNEATQQGGGAYLFAYPPDEFIINQCSFEANTVRRSSSGGALGAGLRTGNAPLTLANSLFVDNHSDVHGGGLWVDGNHLSHIENCTFFNNDAGVPGQEGGYGGALSGANITLASVTIANNHAEHAGGAIFNEDNQSVTIRNSILAHNTAANEWGLDHSCRDTVQGAHNIQWPAPSDEDPPCTADATAADPLLGELSDNGGTTRTMPLQSGSPAIDAGEGCPATDQRGQPRSGSCDLGAFEVQ